MVFKLKEQKKEQITETEIDYSFFNNKKQFNIEIDGHTIVIYEQGKVYVNGKEVANWKK